MKKLREIVSERIRSPDQAIRFVDKFAQRYGRKPEGPLDPEDEKKKFSAPLMKTTPEDPDKYMGVSDKAKMKNIDVSRIRSTQHVVEPEKIKGIIRHGLKKLDVPTGFQTKDKHIDLADGHHRVSAAKALGLTKIRMRVEDKEE